MSRPLKFLCTVLIIILSYPSLARQSQKIEVADQVAEEAINLTQANKYEEAIIKFKEAIDLYTELDSLEKAIDNEIKLSGYLSLVGKFDEAEERLRTSISWFTEKFGESNHRMASLSTAVGTTFARQGQIDSAIFYFNKSVEISKSIGIEESENMSKNYENLGLCYRIKGRYDLAVKGIESSLEIQKKLFGDSDPSLGITYLNLGVTYGFLGLDREEVENYKKGLQLFRENNVENVPYALLLDNLGEDLRNKGSLNQALNYKREALKITSKFFGDDHFRLVTLYSSIALAHNDLGRYDSAIYFNERAHTIYQKWKDKVDLNGAQILSGLALSYEGLGDFKSASEYFLKYIDECKINRDPFLLPRAYNTLAQYFYRRGDYTETKVYAKKAIVDFRKVHGFTNLKTIASFELLSLVDQKEDHLDSALYWIGESANLNFEGELSFENDIDFSKIQSFENFLSTLAQMANLRFHKFKKNGVEADLFSALEVYQLSSNLIDRIRLERTDLGDKITLQTAYKGIFEGAIKANLQAYEITNDIKYLENSFYFSEQSKSATLSDALFDIDARQLSGIPDSLIAQDRLIKARIASYQSKLINRAPGDTVDYQQLLFAERRKNDETISFLEKNYPLYFKLKYGKNLTGVKELQRKITPGTVCLEYFVGDSKIFVFLITKDDFVVKEVGAKVSVLENLSELRNILSSTNILEIDRFYKPSRALYDSLLGPFNEEIESFNPKRLVIVADDELNQLPFDLLVKGDIADDFTSLNYLIKDYSLSYGYSLNLYFDPIKRSEKAPQRLLSFAPSYDEGYDSDSLLQTLGKFRNAVGPLRWNQGESEEISRLLGGRSRLAASATEAVFKNEANDYDILHLAMHALIDDEDPMNSKLVFANNKEDTEDGFLHTFELYNMKLNAKMAVLSACETGFGKLYRGEGVMSLAKGFAYAGVPNIIMSHWRVDDESTSVLMKEFYRNIAAGLSKSESLRQAKLNYLQSASPNKTHPFFWGAFVSIGDDSPLIQSEFPINLAIIIGVAMLLFASYFFFFRKKTPA